MIEEGRLSGLIFEFIFMLRLQIRGWEHFFNSRAQNISLTFVGSLVARPSRLKRESGENPEQSPLL